MEMSKSVDDLLTSQSIGGHRFLNVKMLDAKSVSSLNRIISNPFFNRGVTVEEQKAQTQDRFFRGRQIAFMIYGRYSEY